MKNVVLLSTIWLVSYPSPSASFPQQCTTTITTTTATTATTFRYRRSFRHNMSTLAPCTFSLAARTTPYSSVHQHVIPPPLSAFQNRFSSSSLSLSLSLNNRLNMKHTKTCIQMTLNNSIISSSDHWGNIAVLSTIASLSHFLGKSTQVGRLLGPPVTAMAIAFLLGSIGVLPSGGSPGQKALQLLSIQLATPLLLLSVNIQQCQKTCGPLLKSFLLASLGTFVASVIAFPICAPLLKSTMGKDGLKIAAALLAKNIGGGLNYVAVCRSLDASANAVAAGLCVDNIFALVYFPMTSILAAGRLDVKDENDNMQGPVVDELTHEESVGVDVDVNVDSNHVDKSIKNGMGISTEMVSAALTIGAIATWLGDCIGGQSGGLPVATMITILFTVLCPRISKSVSATGEALGTSLLYLFFATAGAPGLAIANSVKKAFLPLGFFLSLLYGIHGAVLVGSRRFMIWKRKKSFAEYVESNKSALLPQRLLVASSAAIGGPATAAALAKANQWTSLIGPSLIVGNLGYAMATFIGIGFYSVFQMQGYF